MLSYSNFKRASDLLFSFILLATFLPLMVVIYLLLLFSYGNPVVFKQTRLGISDTSFTLYKFRTMKLSHNNSLYSYEGDSRITKLGKLLRITSLDELPQLFNVIKGDMSFVGPRPALPDEIEAEVDASIYFDVIKLRRSVLPGLVSLAIVNGRSSLSWKQKLYYDRLYMHKLSSAPFVTDFAILARTFLALLSSNIYDNNTTA